jgi:hypothetical protein
VCVAAFNVSLNSQNRKAAGFSLANMKALASGEEGTTVGTCYVSGMSGEYESKVPCDNRTDNNTIYPCLSSTLGRYSIYSDRCTK